MSIKSNCYDLVKTVRIGLNEYSDALLQGTDTTGAYRNDDILRKVNDAQKLFYSLVLGRDPQSFLTSTTLTGVASVYTPPSTFYRLYQLEDQYGSKVHRIDANLHRRPQNTGDQNYYYWMGNTIVIDRVGFTDTLTLWYYTKIRELTYGKASAGGVKSMTLNTDAKASADYYNNVTIENLTKGWVDTISDYSAARVATLAAETAAANDWYGTISELHEDFHSLIADKALLLMKESILYQGQPSKTDYDQYNDKLNNVLLSVFGTVNTDTPVQELFY
jgi:hypothetical protein